MSKPKGQHGGRRPGAGRPAGVPNALGYGEVKALKTLRHRVPESLPEAAKEVADEAFETVISVMRGEVHWQEAGPRLKAATIIRSEICGPVAQKLEHGGSDGGPLEIVVKTEGDSED